MLHGRTGNLSAAKLWPGEVETTVPSTTLGMLPLKIPQYLGQSLKEQTREKKLPCGAQQPGRRITTEPSEQK